MMQLQLSFKIQDTIENFEYLAFDSYYPKIHYPDNKLTEQEIAFRQFIWAFKNGNNSEAVGKIVAELIVKKFGFEKIQESGLCIIPASTAQKTEVRFKTFSQTVEEFSGIKNGYQCIVNSVNRNAGHIFGKVHNVLKYVSIQCKFTREIFLFDDIITRGKTFTTIANELVKNGAPKITGIFLGKTSYKDVTVSF